MSQKLGVKNPWVSILVKPKATIRAIVDFNPNYRIFILAAIYGFCSGLQLAQNLKLGEKLSLISILIPVVILAPILGYIIFSIGSWFVFHIGKIIGGQASFKEVRASFVWASVPFVVTALMWIILIFIFKERLFQDLTNKTLFVKENLYFFFTIFSIVVLQLIASIWSLVVYIKAVSEVQIFSSLKAILNVILASLAMAVIFFVIYAAFKWTCSYFFDAPLIVNFFN